MCTSLRHRLLVPKSCYCHRLLVPKSWHRHPGVLLLPKTCRKLMMLQKRSRRFRNGYDFQVQPKQKNIYKHANILGFVFTLFVIIHKLHFVLFYPNIETDAIFHHIDIWFLNNESLLKIIYLPLFLFFIPTHSLNIPLCDTSCYISQTTTSWNIYINSVNCFIRFAVLWFRSQCSIQKWEQYSQNIIIHLVLFFSQKTTFIFIKIKLCKNHTKKTLCIVGPLQR